MFMYLVYDFSILNIYTYLYYRRCGSDAAWITNDYTVLTYLLTYLLTIMTNEHKIIESLYKGVASGELR